MAARSLKPIQDTGIISMIYPLITTRSSFGTSDCLCVRPADELLKVLEWHGAYIHDGDPVKSAHVPRRLYAGHVGQFQKAFWRCANTKAPLLRLAGLEVRELFTARVVNQHITWRPVQC